MNAKPKSKNIRKTVKNIDISIFFTMCIIRILLYIPLVRNTLYYKNFAWKNNNILNFHGVCDKRFGLGKTQSTIDRHWNQIITILRQKTIQHFEYYSGEII
ncbi:hypothetical protein BAVI_02859 [Neobacillus vireti LMG 21834]|uniref:Transposase n=1 Tax=Neobacillus vireti LMG 21834 TaxID=1131730 RepID=A0AB94ITJ1_9BACI|nr:hypothetical protein BAVI_02859 [Neobacillus vireti LMG 21834]KLT16404.1 hypothetical protein AA980_18115 [Neobacillus vireti]